MSKTCDRCGKPDALNVHLLGCNPQLPDGYFFVIREQDDAGDWVKLGEGNLSADIATQVTPEQFAQAVVELTHEILDIPAGKHVRVVVYDKTGKAAEARSAA